MSNSVNLQGKLLFPFIAPPNGGKGTQTAILSQRYNLPTFDMGATFRSILKEGSDPALAEELKSYMNAGKLVPLATVAKVFKKGFEDLAARNPGVKGFILDGFPRSVEQAEELKKLCQAWGASIAKAIYLNVPINVVERRATGRRFCSTDATHVYNVLEADFAPKAKKLENGAPLKDTLGNDIWICDKDGADLIIRPDDEPATVQKRLVEYRAETDPLVDAFRKSGQLAEIKGDQHKDQVTRDIEATIQPLLGLSTAP